jgi:chromosome segregation ATPase
METALQLIEPDPERSKEREALASAIESHAVDLAAVEHIEGALSLARENIRIAKTTVVEAQGALESAKSERTQNLVSQARGELRIATLPAREARAELEAAQDELDACIEAEASLRQQLKQAQSNLSFSAPKLRNAALEVIKTDEATHDYLRRFAEVERAYSTMLAFINGLPLMHPENLSALLGDRRFDLDAAVAPFKDWQLRLATDPDATCDL